MATAGSGGCAVGTTVGADVGTTAAARSSSNTSAVAVDSVVPAGRIAACSSQSKNASATRCTSSDSASATKSRRREGRSM
jgi:hypothetical protein